ncbi:MAG: Glu-tRNA(Gln) amidotransferase GatDE subunit E, partial [Candidatus Thermoplasmatota archaeon]|nr:Glu-tRNA(Gln) amidotransferase GatDE subunit E [Candidatus Thermoplasmatota archaeon]
MDYAGLGLKVGLEIHQQVDTNKLFCDCPSELREDTSGSFMRRLRPTQSELGEVDRAAIEEARKKLKFIYQPLGTTCLVEADEEPPHRGNEAAIDVALEMALLLGAKPVDEIHFMRKIVIDGSNTAGFQRSALVAMNGRLEVGSKTIPIPMIGLEEDAARKIEQREDSVVYRLDRLGIPLVEISTGPVIESPEEAMKVALRLGSLLRATKKV